MKKTTGIFKLAYAGAIATILFCITGQPAMAQERMGIMPTSDKEREISSWFTYELNPGETIEDTFEIYNGADYAQNIIICPSTATTTSEGAFALLGCGISEGGIQEWITINDSTAMTVDAGEKVKGSFTLTVPENASPGDYAGGFLIGPGTDEKNTEEDVSSGGASVKSVINIGVRMYITVKGDVIMDFSWTGYEHSVNDNGQHYLTYTLENDGNVTVASNATVTLESIFSSETIETSLNATPGNSSIEPTILLWEEAPPIIGYFKATTQIEYEKSLLLSQLSGDDQEGSEKETLEKTITFIIIPVKELLVSFILFLIVFAILYGRERKKETLVKNCKRVIVSRDESVLELAKTNNVDWKLLAKINKIKAPYEIPKGTTVLIPPSKK